VGIRCVVENLDSVYLKRFERRFDVPCAVLQALRWLVIRSSVSTGWRSANVQRRRYSPQFVWIVLSVISPASKAKLGRSVGRGMCVADEAVMHGTRRKVELTSGKQMRGGGS